MTKEKPFQFKKVADEAAFQYKPPIWCSGICRNAWNEICIEDCSEHQDAKHFEPKEGMNIEDMPRFPLDDFLRRMTPDERKTCIGIYTARVVDQAQGVRHEHKLPPVRRTRPNGSSGGGPFADRQVESELSGEKKEVTVYQAEQKDEDQPVQTNGLKDIKSKEHK